MHKKLYLVIIGGILLSITAACLLCLLFINKFNVDALLMNLAINSLAIFITVFIVDRILKIHEDEKWKGVNLKIKKSIQKLINATISSVRGAFGYNLNDICSDEVNIAVQVNPEENSSLMHKELIRISKEILEPTVIKNVEKMDKKGWNKLNINLKGIYDFSGTILSLFGSRITPEQFELLMDLQETVNSIFAIYSTWPDIIGVADEDLPLGGRTPPIELKKVFNGIISKDIKSLLQKSRQLFDTMN